MWLWSQNLPQRFLQFLCGVKLLFLLPLFHPPSVFYQSFAWRGSTNLSVFCCQTSDLTNYLAISGHFKNIFFHQQFYVDTSYLLLKGGAVHTPILNQSFSYLIDVGVSGLIYVFHQQFIHVEVHIEIGGWQWSHPFFIANLKILWSLPAFHQQQPPRLCCGCFYTICPGWTLIELFPLLSLFPFLFYQIVVPISFFCIRFCPYFLSYCIRFLIQQHFFPSTRDAQLLMSWPRKLLSFLASCYHRWDH